MTKLNKLKLIGLIAVSNSSNALNLTKNELLFPVHVDGLYNFYSHDMFSLFCGADFSEICVDKGLRVNVAGTVLSSTYKDFVYGIGTLKFGTAFTYQNFKDNFKKGNVDVAFGFGLQFFDYIALEIKGGYSFFKGGKGLLVGASLVYAINNKYRISLSNNELYKVVVKNSSEQVKADIQVDADAPTDDSK